jgi:hypothetical protein
VNNALDKKSDLIQVDGIEKEEKKGLESCVEVVKRLGRQHRV